jgi:hypothetical protein
MDLKKIQPSIDALNAEIQRLTSARDTLQALAGPGAKTINKKPPTKSSARSIAQRKRWAEQKRQQRAAEKKDKK